MSTVVVATDLGPLSDAALRTASAWAEEQAARLVVLRCVPGDVPTGDPGVGGSTARAEALQVLAQDAADAVHARVAELTGRGEDTYEVVIEPGSPDVEIVRVARERSASLVVVGAHASRGATRLLLGNTARAVARYAPCDVLVVRPGGIGGEVLVATDLSESAAHAVRAADGWARQHGRKLSVLYVIDRVMPFPPEDHSMPRATPTLGDELERQAHDDLIAHLRALGVTADDALIAWGPASDSIVAGAAGRAVGLVVLGSLGRTGLARAVMGSTAEATLPSLPCSAWIVRNRPAMGGLRR